MYRCKKSTWYLIYHGLERRKNERLRHFSSLFGVVDAPKWNFIARAKSFSAMSDQKDHPDSAREPLQPLIDVGPTNGRTPDSSGCSSWVLKLCAILALLGILLAPIICLVAAILPGGLGFQSLLAIAVGVPLICIIILVWPVSVYDPDPYQNVGYTQFTLNGNTFNYENYFSKLVDFMYAAGSKTWRQDYALWFQAFTTTDKMVGTMGCGTKMYYSHATCKEKLREMTPRISDGTLKRESQLALGLFNNISWPEVGRFGLGTTKEDHAFVRPFLAEMFSSAKGSWTSASLHSDFKYLFARISTLDHNNRNGHRGAREPFFPSQSKNILTQWTMKILHRIGLGMEITDSEAEELAALQTVSLLAAGATSKLCAMFLYYAFFTKPTLQARQKYIEKHLGMQGFQSLLTYLVELWRSTFGRILGKVHSNILDLQKCSNVWHNAGHFLIIHDYFMIYNSWHLVSVNGVSMARQPESAAHEVPTLYREAMAWPRLDHIQASGTWNSTFYGKLRLLFAQERTRCIWYTYWYIII